MLNELTCACVACEDDLGEDERMLTMETEAGRRSAYECDCGAVTITVHR
jgi:hypothetical protein